MTNISTALAAAFDRIREITETPEYRANADRIAAELKADEERQREVRYRDRLRKTGVPLEVVEKPRENTLALIEAQAFIDGPPALRFLMLGGTKGRGKTFALGAVVWATGGRYLDAHAIVQASTWDETTLNDWATCPLLAVDELGAEFSNPAFEANLYALLDRRYRAGRKSIIATNLNASEFKARYCGNGLDRLLDRMQTGGKWVSLTGPSMRTSWQEVTA